MTVSATDLLFYAGALLVLFATPGPVWVALLARAMSGGFAAAWPLAVGVTIGDALWPLVAVYGLTWIVSQFSQFMMIMHWVAAATFVIMGTLLIRHADRGISADSRLTKPGRMAGFLTGVAVVIGNPKAILFYMGVLPGFFDLTRVTALDIAAIIALSVAIPHAEPQHVISPAMAIASLARPVRFRQMGSPAIQLEEGMRSTYEWIRGEMTAARGRRISA